MASKGADLVASGDRTILIKLYVVKSLNDNFRYVGITDNLNRRLIEHNNGKTKSTSPYRPFKLIYTEEHKTYTEARKREIFLKSGQGRKFLNSLSANNAGVAKRQTQQL